MSLDPSCVGTATEPFVMSYDWKAVVLYALGIGAKHDELDYLYEGRGPRVFPTFGVVPAYRPVWRLLEQTGGNLEKMVHHAQSVRLLHPFPPEGTVTTTAVVEAVYDLKRLAQVVCRSTSRIGDKPVCETTWTLLFRDEGGFGGKPPPREAVPKPPPDRAPEWVHSETTSPEQALLYRLSGDTNPLHADPEFARRVGFEAGPILHGLATFGFVARAVVRQACGGDADRLHVLSAQFRRPVWPGETIRTEGYSADGRLALKAFADERAEAIVTGCYAEID